MSTSRLTKAEEEVMQILWTREKAFVKEIVEDFDDPKPAYNTVSTITRILEKKEFVGHESFGRSHRYFPLIAKDDYAKSSVKNLVKGYFNGSYEKMLSFFINEKDLSTKEIEELIKKIEEK